jgi:hypothetical protein
VRDAFSLIARVNEPVTSWDGFGLAIYDKRHRLSYRPSWDAEQSSLPATNDDLTSQPPHVSDPVNRAEDAAKLPNSSLMVGRLRQCPLART